MNALDSLGIDTELILLYRYLRCRGFAGQGYAPRKSVHRKCSFFFGSLSSTGDGKPALFRESILSNNSVSLTFRCGIIIHAVNF